MSLRGLGIMFSPSVVSTPAPPAFEPSDMGTPTWWFDARTSNKMTLATSSISSWVDTTGVFTGANSGVSRPTYATAVRGNRGAALFTGASSQSLPVTGGTGNHGATGPSMLVIVGKANTWNASFRGIFQTSNGYCAGMTSTAGYTDMYLGKSSIGDLTKPNLDLSPETGWFTVMECWDGSSAKQYYLNETLVTPASGSARAGNSLFTLGYDSNGYWDGYLMHFLRMSLNPTGTNLTNMLTWLTLQRSTTISSLRPASLELYQMPLRAPERPKRVKLAKADRGIPGMAERRRLWPWLVSAGIAAAATVAAVHFFM